MVYTLDFFANNFFATSTAAFSDPLFPTLLTTATFCSFKQFSRNGVYLKMIFFGKTIKYENDCDYLMSYAHPEVLVDTEWVSQNPPNENRKLVEVDYDPVNGYQKGHISGASLIWWKRDINDPVTRDIISKKQFEELMAKNGITKDTEVVLYGDFNNWFAAFVFWVFKIYGHENLKIMNVQKKMGIRK